MPSSSVLDERVVEMRIDNRQFINGAEKTIGILDKLQKALSFRDSGTDLNELSNSFDRIDLSTIVSGIENISARFSNMGIVGMRVLQNLTDSAYRFAEAMVRSLSVDQVEAGFKKYESMLTSTQTIMGATRQERAWESEREQLNYVNAELEKLNWYTDETSFNLTDMVNSVGKFTSAGVALDSAVIDMQGITNWAAAAGATYDEASRAMYNLSQAMATGSVKLMDWRSIENANMATIEFKETVLETAASVGKLKKASDGTYRTMRGTVVTAQNFAQTLSEGWFNTEVLERTLRKYGDFSDVLARISDLNGLTATQLIKATDSYMAGELDFAAWHSELVETMGKDAPTIAALEEAVKTLSAEDLALGRNAFKAAQEYKTFTDVLNATKDAVSSGWMKTIQLIFGDYQESKKLWTSVGEEFYDIFASGAERRNSIFEYWHDELKGGRTALLQGMRNIYEGIRSFIDPIAEAFDEVFSWGTVEEAGQKLVDITKKFRDFTERIKLSEDATAGLKNIFKAVFEGAKSLMGTIRNISAPIFKFIGSLFKVGRAFLEAFSSGKFDKEGFLSDLSSIFGEGTTILDRFAQKMLGVYNFLANAFSSIKSLFITIGNFFVSIFDSLRQVASNAIVSFQGVFSDKKIGFSNVAKLSGLLIVLYKAFTKIRSIKISVDSIVKPLKALVDGIQSAVEAIPELFKKNNLIKQFLMLAGSVALLVGAIVVLSSIDPKKIGISLAALAGGIAELVGTIEILAHTVPKGSKKVTKGLTSLAISLLILSVALKVLSSIDSTKIADTLGYMFVLLAEILVFIELVNLLKIKPRSFAGLIGLAMAMLIFSGVVFVLGSIPYNKLVQGLGALAISLVIVIAAMAILSQFSGAKMIAAGAGMVLLATSLILLAGAMMLFTLINPQKIATALVTLGAALLIITVAVIAMPATLPLIGAGLLLVAAAIGILAATLAVLTLLDTNKLFQSLTAVLVALVGLAAIMAIMQTLLPGALALLAVAAAFAIASVSLIVFAVAMNMLKNLPFEDIGLGMVLIASGLVWLAVGLVAMTVGLIGSVALIATAGGLIVLAYALNMLTGISIAAIAGGLTLLGLAFIPLGIGGVALIAGSVGIMAGAVAIGLMALALIPFTFALQKLGQISWNEILKYLTVFGATAGGLALLTPILTPLAIAVAAFGAACLAAGAGIDLAGSGMKKIADSILVIPDNAGAAFKTVAKTILATVTDVTASGEEVVNAVNAIGDNIVVSIIQNGTGANAVLSSALVSALTLLNSSVPAFTTGGKNVVIGIANGIYSGSSIVIEAMHFLAEGMITQFTRDFGIHSPSRIMERLTANIPTGAARGISNNSGIAADAIGDMGNDMLNALLPALATMNAVLDEDFDFHPHIVPIVDMTNVDSSVSDIGSMLSGSQNISLRTGQGISRSMADIEDMAANIQSISDARASMSQDSYEINIYSQPGMDEATLADEVIVRLNEGIVRKGAALG